MSDRKDSKGRVVIITGGARGIGRATALKFAQEGDHVVVGDNRIEEGQELLTEYKSKKSSHQKGGSLEFFQWDAKSGPQTEAFVQHVIDIHGKIDVLFNNVGIQPLPQIPLHEVSESYWDEVLTVNLKSYFWMCRYVLPHMMKQKKGAIINNASIQATRSQKGVGAYAASKGAIAALTRQLAVEYGTYNIRVNTVSPGSTLTHIMKANTDTSHAQGNTPLGVLGEPEDIAGAVYFLASEGARWVTGHDLVVDGGITITGGWAKL